MDQQPATTLDDWCAIIAQQPDPPVSLITDVRIEGDSVVLDLQMGNRWMWKPMVAMGVGLVFLGMVFLGLLAFQSGENAGDTRLAMVSTATMFLGALLATASIAAYNARATIKFSDEGLIVEEGKRRYDWLWPSIRAIEIRPVDDVTLEVGIGLPGRPAFAFHKSNRLEVVAVDGRRTRVMPNFDRADRTWATAMLNDVLLTVQQVVVTDEILPDEDAQ